MQGSVNAKNNSFREIPPAWGCWDGVHPNSAGYAAMAASIDLSLFNSTPAIQLVANAEGENPTIAPNTWVEVKGTGLAQAGDARIWQGADFVDSQMPVQLDGVSVTVNGKSAFIYYVSLGQVNILTPPDSMSGPVQVVLTSPHQSLLNASVPDILDQSVPTFATSLSPAAFFSLRPQFQPHASSQSDR